MQNKMQKPPMLFSLSISFFSCELLKETSIVLSPSKLAKLENVYLPTESLPKGTWWAKKRTIKLSIRNLFHSFGFFRHLLEIHLFIFVLVAFLHVSMCTTCVLSVHIVQNQVLHFLELEFQMFSSPRPMGARHQTHALFKNNQCS